MESTNYSWCRWCSKAYKIIHQISYIPEHMHCPCYILCGHSCMSAPELLSCPHQHSPTWQWYTAQGQIYILSLKLKEGHNFHGISLISKKSGNHSFNPKYVKVPYNQAHPSFLEASSQGPAWYQTIHHVWGRGCCSKDITKKYVAFLTSGIAYPYIRKENTFS